MGLYDNIIIDREHFSNMGEKVDKYLSLFKKETVDLQTKDLEESLSTFRVQNGQLFYERVEIEWVESNTPDNVFGGYAQVISKNLEERNNSVIVYGCDLRDAEDFDLWIEFKLVFLNGKLEEISLHEYRETDNSARKKREAEIFGELKEYQAFANTLKGKIIIKFKRILSRLLYVSSLRFRNFANKLDKLRYKL
jgi:hypothetical protein